MGAPGAFDASAIQKARTQEPGWGGGSPIRGGVMQMSSVPTSTPAAPAPVKLLKGAVHQSPAGNLPSFKPTIASRSQRRSHRPANLRDRVALTKRLEDPLKDECLERLAGIASRAPPVRRPSWTEDPPEEIAESDDDEVLDLERNLKDLLGGEESEDSPEEQLGAAPDRNKAPQIQKPEPPPAEVEEEADLADMVAQNQQLAAAAGLTTEFPYTWRNGGAEERDDEQRSEGSGSPRSRPEADSFRELYDHADLGLSLTAMPGVAAHWQYNAQIKLRESSSKPKLVQMPKPQQTESNSEQTEQSVHRQPENFSPLPTVQSTPALGISSPVSFVSPETMAEARQAVVAAKAELTAGRADRGSSSLLRTSLRVMMQPQAPS